MTQGVDGELGVADGHEVAGGALNVEDVANAFESHFGADVRHIVHRVHVCFVFVELSQCHKKHLVSEKRGSKRSPSSAVD